jgi:hypothetical protein
MLITVMTVPSFNETSKFASFGAVVESVETLRARETTARGVRLTYEKKMAQKYSGLQYLIKFGWKSPHHTSHPGQP